ncbi:NlpC/P60 family peptidoglycan-binding protein RipD [Mycobacterium sp. MYCO198283]|uniref:NlpC/P60 family peptidoglycan-binding protein RipD n=1 Tax=Mycobacterium sp. MYCO198283 TaxID=2883505 RepID=UPI001E55318A|nr:NlpC/P60 family peptidoglycan-binding protein RipD [Mycobacterium sp. MYCO198283]
MLLGALLVLTTPGSATANPLTRPAAQQRAVELVLSRALSQRGVPFVYGGGDATGPTRPRPAAPAPDPLVAPAAPGVAGFDASGLVVYAFAGAGIAMPRTSADQYRMGRKILPSQALPGDLIFYGPQGTQSVAIFVGNQQMVEATDPAVTVSPVRFDGMTPYLVRIIG